MLHIFNKTIVIYIAVNRIFNIFRHTQWKNTDLFSQIDEENSQKLQKVYI